MSISVIVFVRVFCMPFSLSQTTPFIACFKYNCSDGSIRKSVLLTTVKSVTSFYPLCCSYLICVSLGRVQVAWSDDLSNLPDPVFYSLYKSFPNFLIFLHVFVAFHRLGKEVLSRLLKEIVKENHYMLSIYFNWLTYKFFKCLYYVNNYFSFIDVFIKYKPIVGSWVTHN